MRQVAERKLSKFYWDECRIEHVLPPTNREDLLVKEFEKFRGYRCGLDGLKEYVRFVFDVFADKIGRRQGWQARESDFEQMLAEERAYAEQGFCLKMLDKQGTILLTGRITQGHPDYPFPAETYFDLDLETLAGQNNVKPEQIQHLSQLALNTPWMQEMGYTTTETLEIWMCGLDYLADAARIKGAKYFMLEADKAMARVLGRGGYPTRAVSETRDYIGQTFIALIDLNRA